LATEFKPTSRKRFQLLLGPRRVGKSTSLYQTVKNLLDAGVPAKRLWWLRLDHPLLMQVPLKTLVDFVVDSSNRDDETARVPVP